ncbi:MAG TPA: exopolysaccharide biosynthesis protein [Bacteroidales bacterium]|nr:exopolysaccharide biosynthesis protein [Bacteroidales bacterium]
MKIFKYILRVILKRRWYLIFFPLIASIIAIIFTNNLTKTFKVTTTIFTGFASGYSIESEANIAVNRETVNTAMDNLMNIIKSKSTLERVSYNLYAENMIYGDSTKDNTTIYKNNYIEIFNRTPKDVRLLIDKKSIGNTVKNLRLYSQASPRNFVYGLFNWNHQHYCYDALNKIEVKRIGNSDMLEISYEKDDPGVAYNTVKILIDEFKNEYQLLRFGETDSVIQYFQSELARVGAMLSNNEDSLTDYYVDKKIINYSEQTNQIAFQDREYNLEYLRLQMDYNSSKAVLKEIEKRMDINLKSIKNNSIFIQKLNEISNLRDEIAFIEINHQDTTDKSKNQLEKRKREINNKEKEVSQFLNTYANDRYTKEGISSQNIINEWFTELMKNTKAEAEIKVLEKRRAEIDNEYSFFAPVGSTLKRKEREISFLESTYLNILHNLNSALLRRKNLQMTSSSIKVINPPMYPLNSNPSKRVMIILGVLLGTFIFILSYFIILELIDRTLKNKIKAQFLIGKEVIGAFPDSPKGKYRRHEKEILDKSKHYLFNSIVNDLSSNNDLNIINIISNEKGEGKSFIAENLLSIFVEKNIKAKLISYHQDFNYEDSSYLLANSINDFCEVNDEKFIIIEHPSLIESNIPINILKASKINLFIGLASKAWKDNDQLLFERLKKQCGKENLYVYLNKTSIDATEAFTGLLPPYSWIRKLIYNIIQLDFKTK